MVVPGSIYQSDTGRNKRKTRVGPDAASQRNAAQLKLEAEDAFDVLDHFIPRQGLRPREPPAPSPPIQAYEYAPQIDDDDEDNEVPEHRLAQYLRSRRYREKRARNAELWNGVLPLIFAEYMRLQPKTMAWGHPDLWNKDWHVCDCTEECFRYRDIDMVDLLSEYFFLVRHIFTSV